LSEWQPASRSEVEELLREEVSDLHPVHRQKCESMRVPLRATPIAGRGESVFIVAEFEGQVIYWEDFEEGFEVCSLNAQCEIPERGYDQLSLSHVMYRLFGEP